MAIQIEQKLPRCFRCGKLVHARDADRVESGGLLFCSTICRYEHEELNTGSAAPTLPPAAQSIREERKTAAESRSAPARTRSEDSGAVPVLAGAASSRSFRTEAGGANVRVGVDVGGTFTDLAMVNIKTGELRVSKSPSTPGNPIEGVRAVIEKAGIPLGAIHTLIHGTTVGTNALLERKQSLPALITTKGFRDIVFIQRNNRKHHYDLSWDKPKPFVERQHCYEVSERVNYRGEALTSLDEDEARRVIGQIKAAGINAIAVSFLFSYVNPAHELRMRELISEVHPQATVSLSSEVYPRWREYDRTSTALADAYLKPLIRDYVSNLADGLHDVSHSVNFLIMKSNGGVQDASAAAAKPVDLLVSGPAGGVLSGTFFGKLTGRSRLICTDMGGTSFDVSLIADGEPNRRMDFEIEWGLPVFTPMVDVQTIGAGGGSVAWIDKGGLLRVGPRSAGANPGPACYRRGGTEPTVTDANLVLGRINPDYFLGGDLRLDVDASRVVLQKLGAHLGMQLEDVASSVIELINFNMVNAIRLISIDRGLDPREFTLVSFGGAGSLHAGALADIIGIREVLVPIHQGVFSAFGLMTADMRVDESVTASFRSDALDINKVNDVLGRLRSRALARLRADGYEGATTVESNVEMRYLGQNYNTEITAPQTNGRITDSDIDKMLEDFNAEHRRRYGYDMSNEVIEFVHFNVTAVGPIEKPHIPMLPRNGRTKAKGRRPVYFKGADWLDTAIYERAALGPGAQIEGPAVIEEPTATTLLEAGHSLNVDDYGNLIITTLGKGV
jgi:N-methylhydantoinase A